MLASAISTSIKYYAVHILEETYTKILSDNKSHNNGLNLLNILFVG